MQKHYSDNGRPIVIINPIKAKKRKIFRTPINMSQY